ncbi:unnamed protein product [Linum tenue]|uniref:Uncharacterized protein n=1 Tax=Linum tenue TaxID=586396 RepID=A0AAV0NHL6_9ROSI|nr:unnamed protein product [Linum tenue]CAI0458122.1 unnamed protein product [Linum tenue]
MGFFSFLGRVLFASLFILSAWQMFNEFGEDGGPAAQEYMSKLSVVKHHLATTLAVKMPDIDARHVVAVNMVLKGLGGFLFVFGTPFGAYLLGEIEYLILLNEFLQSVALFGALLIFVGMKNFIPRRQIKKKAAPKAKVG